MALLLQRLFPSLRARALADLTKRRPSFPLDHAAACALAVLLLLHPDSAPAETGACSKQAPPLTAGTESQEQQGLKVFIDPDTGELISEPASADAAEPAEKPAKAADQPELPVTTRPDGTLVLDLSDNPVNELRVEKVDGKLIECHREVAAPAADGDARAAGSGTDHDD